MLPDAKLIEAAMGATGLSARALSHVLQVDESTLRRWLMRGEQSSKRGMPGPARQLCRLLMAEPSLVLLLGPE